MKMIKIFSVIAIFGVCEALFAQNNADPKPEIPFLGVYTNDYPQLEEGVLVEGVYRGFSAATSGLQRGDILLEINKEDVNSSRELLKELRTYKIGDEIEVTYLRFNQKSTVKVLLSEQPKYVDNLKIESRDEASSNKQVETKAFLGIFPSTDWQAGGVRIIGFTNKSAARKAGLETDDIILKLDETNIETAEQLSNYLLEKTPGSEIVLVYLRNGKEKVLKMTLGAQKVSDNNSMGRTDYRFEDSDIYCEDCPNMRSEKMEAFGEKMAKFAEEMARHGERITEELEEQAENLARDIERGRGRGERRGDDNWSSDGGNYFSLNNLTTTPNPTVGNLTISFSGRSNQPFSVVLSDENGREIARENRDSLIEGLFTQQFDLTREPIGIYYVRIYKGEEVITSQKVEKK